MRRGKRRDAVIARTLAQVVTFPQAPDSEYLRVFEAGSIASGFGRTTYAVDSARLGWVAPGGQAPEERWDDALTRMGWVRSSEWKRDQDGTPSCTATRVEDPAMETR